MKLPTLEHGRLKAAIASSLLLAALVATPAMAANAAVPAAASPHPTAVDIAPQAQAASESAVASFVAANPTPILPANATSAQFMAFSQQLYSYWQRTPWTDVFGQWGCTVSDVQPQFHATAGAWGQAGAAVSMASYCSNAAANPVSGNIASKTQILAAHPEVAAALAAPATSATPNVISECGSTSTNHICIYQPEVGQVATYDEYIGTSGTETGHDRIGIWGAGVSGCGAGTLYSTGGTTTMPPGGVNRLITGANVDTKWSGQYYDPSEAAQACGTF